MIIRRRVFVYNHYGPFGRGKNRPLAYTRYQGSHACEHIVEVERGTPWLQVTRKAVLEHLANPACDQRDPYA